MPASHTHPSHLLLFLWAFPGLLAISRVLNQPEKQTHTHKKKQADTHKQLHAPLMYHLPWQAVQAANKTLTDTLLMALYSQYVCLCVQKATTGHCWGSMMRWGHRLTFAFVPTDHNNRPLLHTTPANFTNRIEQRNGPDFLLLLFLIHC